MSLTTGDRSEDVALPALPGPDPGDRRRTVLTGGLWNAAAQLLPSVGVALLSVVAARLLGADALGRQSLIAYVSSALGAVVVTGLTAASLRELGTFRGRDDVAGSDAFGSWTVRAHVAAGLAVFAILAVTGLLVGRDRLAWLIIGVVAVVDAAVSGIAVRVAVRDGWSQIGRLQLVAQLVGPLLGVAAVAAGLGIPGIFGGDGVAALALLVVFVVRFGPTLTRARPRRLRPPVPMLRSWLLFAGGDLVNQVVTRRIEFVVLAIVSTDRQIATYSIAFMLVSLLAQVPGAVAAAALPLVAEAHARGEDERAAHHLRLAVRVGTLLAIPLAGLVTAVGPPLVLLVYGSDYAAASRLVALAGSVLLVAPAAGVCAQFWSGRGRLGVVVWIGTAAGVIDVATAFAAAPALGATGAVVANLVGQAVAAAGLLAYTTRRLGGVGWPARSLVGMAAATLAGAGGATAVVVVVRWASAGVAGPLSALAQLAAGTTVGVVVFVAVAVAVKVVGADERTWIAPLLPTRVRPLLQAVST